jgi:anaphase-promoting complex subunit 6
VQSNPSAAVTWYCIGCYYWSCRKLQSAQAYLQKATKLDKRFGRAWIALGHVLVSAEESDLAISAFRTACRLMPGDHRPPTYMAKELVRQKYMFAKSTFYSDFLAKNK